MRTQTTGCREYREGWIGRRRMYKCRLCGYKFQVDTLRSLPQEERIRSVCKEKGVKGVVELY